MKIIRDLKNLKNISISNNVSLIFGHFEILHPGHLELFLEAKKKIRHTNSYNLSR